MKIKRFLITISSSLVLAFAIICLLSLMPVHMTKAYNPGGFRGMVSVGTSGGGEPLMVSSSGAGGPIIVIVYTPLAGSVVFYNPNPTDTTIILSWIPVSGATNYVIRYSTDTYPATYTANKSAYNGAGTQCTVKELTAGTTYFFSAWAYDGDYSSIPGRTQITTLAVALPTGGQPEDVPVIPIPTVPASANQAPSTGGFHLEPFTSIISYFTDNTTGGLGMPENYAWETLAILGIVGGGLFSYIKMKNFFIAYFVVFILTCIFVGLHLVQGYLAAAEIVVGAGVWALERFFQ
jgi:hypothetical protein